jgi:sporulation protein YlmC with PRC-barrel domain
VTIAETELIAPGWRASKLIGSEVRNDKGEKIGKIDDLIISPDGTLSVAAVNVGGFIDIAGRKVAIPVGQFQKLAVGKAVLRGATRDELKKLPEFQYTQ